MSKEIFSRYELKYLIPFEQYKALVPYLLEYMRYDKFGKDGVYNIISLYFESEDDKIYYETRNKLKFRQKLRLRIYNDATIDDYSFLEVKQKYNNVVNKRRTKIKLRDAYNFIDFGTKNMDQFDVSNKQILNEIKSFKDLYKLKPRVVVSYDRQAFHGIEDADLRVTFDYNLMCRDDNLRIEDGPKGAFFVDPDKVVMEVKVSHSVPFWLSRLLSDYECQKGSASKFCTSIDLTNRLRGHEFDYSKRLMTV